MNSDKQIIIDEILERINKSPFVIVTDYTGITVDQFTQLRNRLRATGSQCQVAKNSFVKRALRDVDAPAEIEESLNGQTAIVTGESDICAAAKELKKFASETSKASVKSGLLDGKYLSAEEVTALADLPPKEVLLAKLLGVLQQPATNLARVLNEPGSGLARVLQAKNDAAGE